MTETNRLCLGCMNEKENDGPCEKCGYSNDAPYLPSYLAPGTILNDRYIVGKLLSYNGEGATYIGFDKVTNSKVTVKEYMPDTLCSRKKGDPQITVDSNQLPLYKTYMSEFVELNKALLKARSMTHIQTVLDIFPQNNTAYVIFEYINGITLKNYLANCSGELSWDRVKELFPPILTTLSLVHSAGIIHRGISPQTILVTEKNELKLIDFEISAGRTTGTEIACEMYPGYSAPEQYSSTEWHGTWTDVYGISATLYRVLTGCAPTESISRLGNDNCPEPMVINRNIPSHVSKVIMNGLKLNTSNRIQTITELVVKLFEQPRFNTAEQEAVRPPVQRVKRIESEPVQEKPAASGNKNKKKNQSNKGAIIATLIACGVIIIGFLIAIIILGSGSGDTASSDPNAYSAPESVSSEESSAPQTTQESSDVVSSDSSADDITYLCPTFTERLFTSIQNNTAYSYIKITAEYKFNDEVANGIVISQSIKANTEIKEGTEIKLVVSKGPSTVALPDYTGMKVDEYTAILSQKNIKFEKKETTETNGARPGYVVKCSKKIGDKIDVEHSETVTVYYAKAGGSTTSSNSESSTASKPESSAAQSTAQ
ncbi:MAG: PASTA domain-containing protein [Ruminiclostridium sp.]